MNEKLVINLADLEYEEFGHGERFHASRASISARIGGEKLGYGLVVLQPGKRAWPYHSHYVNEEMFYVLEGEGTLRHAGEEIPIRAGDFVCSPADPELPHQIINTSKSELKYLCVSTMEDPDICLYPDSDKYGAYVGPFGKKTAVPFRVLGRKDDGLDYWDGEN